MRHAQFLRTLVVLALIAFTTTLVFGQAVNFATIHGRVTDKSDAAIPGAEVKATQVATGLVRTATSTADGDFVFPNLPVGEYKVQVSAKGFKEFSQTGITLTVGSSAQISAKLEVGAVNEVVEVHADATMVETHENSIQTLIDNNRIVEMPLNGRSATALLMLSGAASDAAPVNADLNSTKNIGNGQAGGQNPTVTVSVGGSQQNSNNFILDGGDNNDSFSNVNAPLPFPDAIQEFSVQTSGLSARYGKQAGAVVNAITKSGTNNFHGSLFEFLRNPYLNAKHVVFTQPAPLRDDTMKRNQYGGTFGGPIKKDKLMFFTGFQGTRTSYSPAPSSAIIPTRAALNGDFSTMLGTSAGCKTSAVTLKSSYGFTNNQINPSAFSPQALKLTQYLPIDQADPCGRITYTIPGVTNEEQGVAKVDWNLSQKQSAFARYFVFDQRNPVEFDPTNILTQATSSQFARYQTIVLGHTYTLDSGMVNSARVMFKRIAINRGPATGMLTLKDLGVDVDTPVPAGMVLGVSNYFNVGGGSSMPGHFINNAFQIADDVDVLKGKHQISFGVNWMKLQLNYLSTFQSDGQFTFGAGTRNSGDNIADFLLGLPSSFTQGNPEWENWRMNYQGLYIHDNYRILPNLTLNAGVRWEPYLPSIDTAHRGSHFDFNAFMAGTRSVVYPNAPAGLQYCGDPDVPCAFQNRKWKQFAPRFGVIWDPRGKGKETIRAGYGIFYDSPEMYYFDRYADNSPFGSGVSFAPTSTAGSNSFATPWMNQTRIDWPTPFPQPGSSTGVFPLNGVYINNDFDVKPMYTQNWNLSIEKQFGANWSIAATYLGSKSTHVWFAYEANPALNQAVASAAGPGCTVGQAASTSNTNCRRALYVANPDQGKYFSNMTTLWDGADAIYNGLLLTGKHRFSNNFTFMTNYTWSHCMSDQDFSGEVTNSRPALWPVSFTDTNPDKWKMLADRGNCQFDVRQAFNASGLITTPKQTGILGAIVNNWQLAPMITYRTGYFFTVTTGVDSALTGAKTGGFLDRPNQIGDPYNGTCTSGGVTRPVGDRFCWFNTSAFGATSSADVIAPYGPLGNVRRNSISGPGAFNFNASTSRKFAITEGKELTLRLEVFNVLNHPNLALPTAARNSSNFGQIRTQNGDGRMFQGAIKFTF